jgi:hypothetical protein
LAVEEVELQTLVLLLEMISIVPHTKTEKWGLQVQALESLIQSSDI